LKKVFILLSLATVLSCTKESTVNGPPTTDNVADTIYKNLVYGYKDKQNFDLYLPAHRSDTTPVIILIHGGGWHEGDKNDLAFFAQIFQGLGFAVANINYRLSPQSDDNFKMQLDDIESIVNLLLKNSGKYIFSKDRFYITGHSAGAHLSLSFAYTRNSTKIIKAAAGMATPTNLYYMAYYNPVLFESLLTPYLGVPLSSTTEARYKTASPYFQATATSVPTILFQGDLDVIISKDQANMMKSKLDELGVENKLIIYPFIFHDWWSNFDLVKNTVAETITWFNVHR